MKVRSLSRVPIPSKRMKASHRLLPQPLDPQSTTGSANEFRTRIAFGICRTSAGRYRQMSIAFESPEAPLQKLRERLRKMSNAELMQFGKTVREVEWANSQPHA